MSPSQDLTRNTLAVLLIAGLILATFWVLRPFLPAALWGTTIAVSTWPLMLRLQARLLGRRSLAVTVMLIALLLAVFLPVVLAAETIKTNAPRIGHWVSSLTEAGLPQPPSWVESLPVIGQRLAARWRDIATGGPPAVESMLHPYVQQAGTWALKQVSTVAVLLLHLALTFVITAILYAHGESASKAVESFARRVAGPRGEKVVLLAAHAIRSVALGIVLTALVQSVLTAIGLAVVGVPNAIALGALTFALCVAQLGPALILVPAIAWLYWSGEAGWGTALLVWSIPVLALDNVLRPILIRRGADLPLLLIFAGVIGGLFAFGIIGLFIGPVVLAIAYTLLDAWVSEIESNEPALAEPENNRGEGHNLRPEGRGPRAE